MTPFKTLLAAGLTAAAALLPALARADITVTDLRGRTVTLAEPAKHVLLGFYYEDFLAVAGPGAVDKIAALSRLPWADWRPGQWAAYTKVFPQLNGLPDVGDTDSGTFSVEKAIAAHPDVALLAGWQYDALGDGVKQMEAAGIKVVVLDYNAQTLEKHLASTEVLGAVMGTPDRAAALEKLYKEKTEDTLARIAKAGAPSLKAYVELAQKGPDTVGNSYATSMWGGVIATLKGANIATGQIGAWGPLSPEYVLAQQPDVILLAGSEWKNAPAAVPMGFGADPAVANARMAAYLKRPGWADLPAVKDGHVYAIYHGGNRTLSDFAYTRFIAKALYPAAFADVDPQAELAAYYKDWLPVVPEGVFFLQYHP